MGTQKPKKTALLTGVSVQVTASAQAALLLTPLLVQLSGRGIEIVQEEPGLWRLEAWMEGKGWSPRSVARVKDACRRLAPHFGIPVPPSARWECRERRKPPPRGEKRFFRPFLATERLWVAPPGSGIRPAPEQALLELELGKARGSGIHPATRCALRLLEGVLTQGPVSRVLDVGTGSGILALAAVSWGAGSAVALDTDPHAVSMARRNARRNGMRGRVEAHCRDVRREGGSFPLVAAHLSHKSLTRFGPHVIRRVKEGGWLVLGGIWHGQVDGVLAGYSPSMKVVRREREAWWEAVLLSKDAHDPRSPTAEG
jgi:SAM-dependent methyltransferase